MMVGCLSIGAHFVNIECVLRLLRRVRSTGSIRLGVLNRWHWWERLRLELEPGAQRKAVLVLGPSTS